MAGNVSMSGVVPHSAEAPSYSSVPSTGNDSPYAAVPRCKYYESNVENSAGMRGEHSEPDAVVADIEPYSSIS